MEHLLTSAVSAKQAFNKVVKPNPSFNYAKRYYIVDCLENPSIAEAEAIALKFTQNPSTTSEDFKLRRNTVGCIVLKNTTSSTDDSYMFFKLEDLIYD